MVMHDRRPARAPRTALAVAALALALAAAAPSAPANASSAPLPACRYDDVLTAPRAYADWSKTLVDTILEIPATYVPPDLAPISDADIPGPADGQVRAVVIDDLRAMTKAAAAAGAKLAVLSPYRSYQDQKSTFQHWVDVNGYAGALKVSARPGHSEHQLGLAIDFKTAGGSASWDTTDWATTTEGAWLKAHGWQFGFVMSYPKGKESLSCYSYEPWHYRYVGRDIAAAIHASGLVPRQYLWAHFTTALVPAGSPAPGGTPRPSATPAATAEPSPDATPAATDATPSVPPAATATPTALPVPSDVPAGTTDDPSPALVGQLALLAIGVVAIVILGAALRAVRRPAGRRR